MRRHRQLLTSVVSMALVFGSLAWLTGIFSSPQAAHAATSPAVEAASISDSPSEGVAGSTVVVETDLVCSPTTFNNPLITWDSGRTILGKFTADEPVTVEVPSTAALGTHDIIADCNNNLQSPVNVPFTVIEPTTTPPTTTPTTSVSTTRTTRKSSVTTTTPTTVHTTPRTTGPTRTTAPTTTPTSTPTSTSATTTAPTTTMSTTASTPPTTRPRGTPTTAASTTARSTPGHVLKLSSLSVSPGQDVSAFGNGCATGATVAVSIGGAPVGSAVAGVDGTYRAPLQIASIPVGRYTVTAKCGPVLADAALDVVLASQVSADTSTLSIIVFVILLGAFLYRRRLLPRPRPTPPPRHLREEGMS